MYELTFDSSGTWPLFPKYTRHHDSLEDAIDEAFRVEYELRQSANHGPDVHPCVIYGHDLNPDGLRLW